MNCTCRLCESYVTSQLGVSASENTALSELRMHTDVGEPVHCVGCHWPVIPPQTLILKKVASLSSIAPSDLE